MQATIVIKDEVNCTINGLELGDRKTLTNKFKYEIPGAKYQPSVRLGRWDGKVSYFQISGSTYINLLPEILPFLESQGYEIEIDDRRQYSTVFAFNEVTETTFADRNWPTGHPAAGKPVLIRDYQVGIVNNFLNNPQSVQEIATGAGKTLMTAALSASVEQYGRSIVIVPNKSLVTQTESDYKNLQLNVGVYFGDRKEWGKTHTICTWQSLNNLLKDSQNGSAEISIKEFIEDVVCLIVNECFDGNEKVLTVDGYVPIKDIKPGDVVINYSENLGVFKKDIVVKQHVNLAKSMNEKMYELEFDNGNVIKVTGNHKFLTTIGWVRADELTTEHEIITNT